MSQERAKQLIAEAKGIIATAEREDRDLTLDESRRVDAIIKRVEVLNRDNSLSKKIDEIGGFGGSNDGTRPATKLSALVKDALRQMGAKDLSVTPSAIVS